MTKTISIAFLMAVAACLSSCAGTDKPGENGSGVPETDPLGYDERHRPQFHFSPPEKWMNDPNGMVYYEGEYHLFYQFYPDANVWGPMHWGHAASTDLVHWESLPVALYPDSLGYIFSGSAVVDWNNTSGFGTVDTPPLVAVFTYHDPKGAEEAGNDLFQTQGIAYSVDKGRSWTKYEGNPVIQNPGIRDFRDPKVFWHNNSSQWVMILAQKDHVGLWGSPDLKSWESLSTFGHEVGSHGGVWECPDLFELEVGNGERKWVMLVSINPGGPQGGSATQYFVGDFDGRNFTLDPSQTEYVTGGTAQWIDYGADNYAGVTWSDIPESDGRRLFIGWMSNWQYATVVPTEVWRSAMTLPRELTLQQVSQDDGGPYRYLLRSEPIKELDRLRNAPAELQVAEDADGGYKAEGQFDGLGEFVVEAMPKSDYSVTFSNEDGDELIVGMKDEVYFIDRRKAGESDFHQTFAALHEAPAFFPDSGGTMRIYIDHSSVEMFADAGGTVLTDIAFPSRPYTKAVFHFSEKDAAKVTAYSLKRIW